MMPSDKGKYGGHGKRGWDTYKYEKMGGWNRAQDQQKRKAQLEASKPKTDKVTGYDHQKSANWQSLGTSSSTTQSLGAWGRKDTLAGVRSEEAVVKPEVTKMTMEVISSKGKVMVDEATFMDQGRTSQLPTGPKKFKSQTVALPSSRPALTRNLTSVQKSNDAWSDDEDDYHCSTKSFGTRKGPLVIPGLMNQVSHTDFDADMTEMEDWEADQAEYA